MAGEFRPVEFLHEILDKVKNMSKATPMPDNLRGEELRRKARAGRQLTVEERLELFDVTTKRLDELQAEPLKEAQVKGTRITRENRAWTREELYNDDRGLPRGFPRRH